jgi:Uma2 family endonuclease
VRLTELGAFGEHDSFELIGGEIVPMSPSSRRHEIIREELAEMLRCLADQSIRIVEEPQFNLADDTYTKPDLLVRPHTIRTPDLRGPDVFLVVEIAHTSLKKATGFKVAPYASFGIREYWVVDASDLSVRQYRDPRDGQYATCVDVEAGQSIAPFLLAHLAVRLANLDVT